MRSDWLASEYSFSLSLHIFSSLSHTHFYLSLYISPCLWLSLSHHCLSFYPSMFHSLTQSLFISFLSLPPLPLVISLSLWDCLSLSLFPTPACLSIFLSLSRPFSLFLYLVSPTVVSLSTYLGVALSLPSTSPFLPFSLSNHASLSILFISLISASLHIFFSLSFFLSLWLSLVHPWPVFIFLCFFLPLSLDIFSFPPTPVFLFEIYLCL